MYGSWDINDVPFFIHPVWCAHIHLLSLMYSARAVQFTSVTEPGARKPVEQPRCHSANSPRALIAVVLLDSV